MSEPCSGLGLRNVFIQESQQPFVAIATNSRLTRHFMMPTSGRHEMPHVVHLKVETIRAKGFADSYHRCGQQQEQAYECIRQPR